MHNGIRNTNSVQIKEVKNKTLARYKLVTVGLPLTLTPQMLTVINACEVSAIVREAHNFPLRFLCYL